MHRAWLLAGSHCQKLDCSDISWKRIESGKNSKESLKHRPLSRWQYTHSPGPKQTVHCRIEPPSPPHAFGGKDTNTGNTTGLHSFGAIQKTEPYQKIAIKTATKHVLGYNNFGSSIFEWHPPRSPFL